MHTIIRVKWIITRYFNFNKFKIEYQIQKYLNTKIEIKEN